MISSALRSVAAEMVIGMSVCVGAYAVLIEPIERELDQAARMNSQVEAERRRLEQGTLEPEVARRLLDRWTLKAERLEQMGRPARDEASLMAMVSDLARERGVRIEQVQPEAPPAKSGATPNATPGGAGATPAGAEPDARAALNITLIGSFQSVTGFLNALETIGGHTRVASVRLTPSPEPGSRMVTAVVRTEHFAFGVPGMRTVSAASGEATR